VIIRKVTVSKPVAHGQKLDKEDKEGYRSSEQKTQRGNHGGNR